MCALPRFLLAALVFFITMVGPPGSLRAADDLNSEPAQPPGIEPTVVTLAQIIAAAERAFGQPKNPVLTTAEVWKVKWEDRLQINDLRIKGDDFVVSTTMDGVPTSHGRYHGQLWEHNDNNLTVREAGIHREPDVGFGLIWRVSKAEGARVLGEVVSPVPAYVVEVTPPHGFRTWLFFDASSGLLDRAVIFQAGQYSYDFSEYSTVNGLTLANRVHVLRPDTASVDFELLSRRYNDPVSDDSLQIPQSRPLVEFPESVDRVPLPSRVGGWSNELIIVRVTINGRGLDLMLDSGAEGIVLDTTVADELGLRIVGAQAHELQPVARRAFVPEMDIGDLRLHNFMVALDHVETYPDATTKVVGFLGFDFLADAVVKVDYVRGNVEAFRPSNFSPPPNAVAMDAVLDDYVPMVRCGIGGATAEDVIVDTGAIDSLLMMSRFINAHFPDAPDPKKTVLGIRYFPYAGGLIPVAEYHASSVAFAGYTFGGADVYVTYRAPKFEEAAEDIDGFIGYGFLQYFDVYIDYPHARLLTVPNEALESMKRLLAPAASHR